MLRLDHDFLLQSIADDSVPLPLQRSAVAASLRGMPLMSHLCIVVGIVGGPRRTPVSPKEENSACIIVPKHGLSPGHHDAGKGAFWEDSGSQKFYTPTSMTL